MSYNYGGANNGYFDNGSCCGSMATFVTLIGTIGSAGTMTSEGMTAENYEHNKYACVAFKNDVKGTDAKVT